MRRFGQFLMVAGATVGVAVAIAIFMHFGLPGMPWVVNVGMAKLGLLASGSLMASGAFGVRIANERQARQLASHDDQQLIGKGH